MPLKTKIIYSLSNNPWYNLALEEFLLESISQDEVLLYLWQNQRTVVIGRNQNAWKECNYKALKRDEGKLARRLSGGGAVFHDLGNLNFTFIMGRANYYLNRQLRVIIEAVKQLGIGAEFSGRNDLLVEGKKFSGNAFYFAADKAYHHGTLLLDTDFTQMLKYLQVSAEKIASKGIDSVRFRVVNLKGLKADLNLEMLKQAMEISFLEEYGGEGQIEYLQPEDISELKGLYEKYSSWEWLFGSSPDFNVVFEKRFPWGGLELCLQASRGVIEEAVIYSDAMEVELIRKIAEMLKGCIFDIEEISERIKKINPDKNKEIITDIVSWLKEKNI
ncbi:MAG: lipoate--protein ligase [Firmicutes bacterium]|nr:lipoate--protein ligase [Bacillota bacterium]